MERGPIVRKAAKGADGEVTDASIVPVQSEPGPACGEVDMGVDRSIEPHPERLRCEP